MEKKWIQQLFQFAIENFTGRPTMEKAEALKLQKEAAELDTGNILADSGNYHTDFYWIMIRANNTKAWYVAYVTPEWDNIVWYLRVNVCVKSTI